MKYNLFHLNNNFLVKGFSKVFQNSNGDKFRKSEQIFFNIKSLAEFVKAIFAENFFICKFLRKLCEKLFCLQILEKIVLDKV